MSRHGLLKCCHPPFFAQSPGALHNLPIILCVPIDRHNKWWQATVPIIQRLFTTSCSLLLIQQQQQRDLFVQAGPIRFSVRIYMTGNLREYDFSWWDGAVFLLAVLRDVTMAGTHDFRACAHHDLCLLEWLFDFFHPFLEFCLSLMVKKEKKKRWATFVKVTS